MRYTTLTVYGQPSSSETTGVQRRKARKLVVHVTPSGHSPVLIRPSHLEFALRKPRCAHRRDWHASTDQVGAAAGALADAHHSVCCHVEAGRWQVTLLSAHVMPRGVGSGTRNPGTCMVALPNQSAGSIGSESSSGWNLSSGANLQGRKILHQLCAGGKHVNCILVRAMAVWHAVPASDCFSLSCCQRWKNCRCGAACQLWL